MQRDLTCTTSSTLSTDYGHQSSKRHLTSKLLLTALTAGMLTLSGCQTIKGLTGDTDDDVVATAKKTYAQYYSDAMRLLDKGDYLNAAEQLSELRIFYPTGPYAEDALLNLMYAQFQNKEYELAAGSAEQFIKLYPRNIQVDYAYYVRGVSNMQAGTSTLLHLAKLNQAHRDNAYMRLAFSHFQELINRYPNSKYAPDAAQRMRFIYNQFAEGELAAARWYIKRDAYVAAANRAKWVFQYYPLSEQVPESIAILAYSHEQLGLDDLAKQYKTLLQINYPDWLTANGQVKLADDRSNNLLSVLTFGKLGRANDKDSDRFTGSYNGQTKAQVIGQAAQLQLPDDDSAANQASMASLTLNRGSGINLGLGLPQQDRDDLTNQTNPNSTINPNVRPNPPALAEPVATDSMTTDAVALEPVTSEPIADTDTDEAAE